MTQELKIYIDGGSRGNPGAAGAAAVIYDQSGEIVAQVARYLGETTNNIAEYNALLMALNKAAQLGGKRLQIFSDSELLVRQYCGEYRVKHQNLIPLYLEAMKLARQFERVTLTHIPREKNRLADALVNKTLDERRLA